MRFALFALSQTSLTLPRNNNVNLLFMIINFIFILVFIEFIGVTLVNKIT